MLAPWSDVYMLGSCFNWMPAAVSLSFDAGELPLRLIRAVFFGACVRRACVSRAVQVGYSLYHALETVFLSIDD
jgi:hypothetical protein